MLKFISFGSGSSGNCYYLYNDTEGLIIDAGVGVRTLKKYLNQYGLSFKNLKYVLITHDHADHIKSVGSISNDYKLDVYSTQNVHASIDRNYCVKKKIAATRKHYVKPGEAFVLGGFTVTAFHVPHDSTDNVGYKVTYDGMTFALMTDVGHVTEEMKQIIGESDYLVIEANHDEEMLEQGPYPAHLKKRILSETGHLSNLCCAKAVAENMNEHLKHVWLCHLSEENNHHELANKTVESTLRTYGIIVGKDVELDVLKRKTPSGVYELK